MTAAATPIEDQEDSSPLVGTDAIVCDLEMLALALGVYQDKNHYLVRAADFISKATQAAREREKGYLHRKHGSVVNGQCADTLVELCKEFGSKL